MDYSGSCIYLIYDSILYISNHEKSASLSYSRYVIVGYILVWLKGCLFWTEIDQLFNREFSTD